MTSKQQSQQQNTISESQKQQKFLLFFFFKLKCHGFKQCYFKKTLVLNIFNIILKNMIFLSAVYITIKSKSYLNHQQLIFFPLRYFKQDLSLFLHKIKIRQSNPSVISWRWPHICNELNTLKYFIFQSGKDSLHPNHIFQMLSQTS